MEAYFDNSATTRCYPEVAEIVVKTMTEDFGNPSAMHLKGVDDHVVLMDTISKRYSACGGRIGAFVTKNKALLLAGWAAARIDSLLGMAIGVGGRPLCI